MIMKDLIKKILKEDNDFDWARESEPISKSEIANKLSRFDDFGFRIYNEETNPLVNSIYNLGLNTMQLDSLIKSLYEFGYNTYDRGIDTGSQNGYSEGESQGYDMGHRDGYSEAKRDMEDKLEEKYEKGYDEGYDEAIQDGYQKGYEEGVESTYYKAFEEGRAYEAGVEVEDLERRESDFDPSEYDEDYNEDY